MGGLGSGDGHSYVDARVMGSGGRFWRGEGGGLGSGDGHWDKEAEGLGSGECREGGELAPGDRQMRGERGGLHPGDKAGLILSAFVVKVSIAVVVRCWKRGSCGMFWSRKV